MMTFPKTVLGIAVAATFVAPAVQAALYDKNGYFVDGVQQTPVQTEGEWVFGKADATDVRLESHTYYGLLAGHVQSGPITETVTALGKNITIIGLQNKAVWCRADNGVDAFLNLGDDSTESITITNLDTEAEGVGLMVMGSNKLGKSQARVKNHKLVVKANKMGIGIQNNSQDETLPQNGAVLNIDADSIYVTAGESGIAAYSNGVGTISGNLTVDAPWAIDARGHSSLKVNVDGNHSTVLNGDIVFETPNRPGNGAGSGNLIDADVEVNLTGADSRWTGSSYKYYQVQNDETGQWEFVKDNSFDEKEHYGGVDGFKLTIADQGQWVMTGNSFVNDVSVNDLGTIIVKDTVTEFNADKVTLNDGVLNVQGKASLSVNTLTGNRGSVNLVAQINDDQSLTSGTVTVGKAEAVKLNVVVDGITADDLRDVNATMSSLNEKVVVTGDSSLTKTNTIVEGDVNGAFIQKVDKDGNKSEIYQAVNQKLDGYSSIAALSAVQWRHENDTLLKRMGELRDAEGTVGAWARIYGSEQEYGAQSVKAKNTTIQVGSDYDIGSGWTVGGAFSYTDGSSTFDMGESDSKMYGLSVYGTYLADNGLFVDLIGKYSRLSNDFTSGTMKGDFDNNAFSIAAETGWHYAFNTLGFVEPSVGVTYGRIMGDDFVAHNGVKVEQDDYDSLIGRVGVRGGFYFPEKKGNIYARVAVLHDFMGDMEATASKYNKATGLNTSHLKEELGDTWIEYGLGANFKLAKNAYTYVDLEKTAGSDVKENWKWTIGARYMF